MLKKLFDFKMSKQMVIAKIIMLVCIAVAIVITGFGLKEIIDVPHMKTLLDVTRPKMGEVLFFLLKKYVGWALLVLVAGIGSFLTVRFIENNKKAA